MASGKRKLNPCGIAEKKKAICILGKKKFWWDERITSFFPIENTTKEKALVIDGTYKIQKQISSYVIEVRNYPEYKHHTFLFKISELSRLERRVKGAGGQLYNTLI